MRFSEYVDIYSLLKRLGRINKGVSPSQFYREAMGLGLPDQMLTQALIESPWAKDSRPYYNLWPVVTPSLLNMRLDIGCGLVKLPLDSLLLRFPHPGHDVDGCGVVRSILAANVDTRGRGRGLGLLIDCGERQNETPIYLYRVFPLNESLTVEEAINVWDVSGDCSTEEIETGKSAIRVLIGVCLLAKDPDLIEPDVLNKDKKKLEQATTQEEIDNLANKAVSRGKKGWNVGERLDTNPHYRRAHMGWRWTGKGRATPKLVPIKGAVVRRSKMSQVPTGYLNETRVCHYCGAWLTKEYKRIGDRVCAECKAKIEQSKKGRDSHHTPHSENSASYRKNKEMTPGDWEQED